MKAKMNKWSVWVDETRLDVLHGYLMHLLREAGFSIISCQTHMFEPCGFTELILLGESHLAVHTFPEQDTTYIELSSCVDGPYERFIAAFDPKAIDEHFRAVVAAEAADVRARVPFLP